MNYEYKVINCRLSKKCISEAIVYLTGDGWEIVTVAEKAHGKPVYFIIAKREPVELWSRTDGEGI